MIYLLLTLSLVSLGILTFLPQCQPLLRRYQTGINFILTLVATLIGVLLAIAITNYDANRQEIEDLTKLLRATTAVVDTSRDYGRQLLDYHDKLADDDPAKANFFDTNPPPYPDYLDTLMAQPLTSKNLSGEGLTELSNLAFNLKKTRQHRVALYLALLEQTAAVLALEIRYQQGEIDLSQLDQALEQLSEQVNDPGTG